MKKTYINPKIQVVKMQTSTLICTSSFTTVQMNLDEEMEKDDEFE